MANGIIGKVTAGGGTHLVTSTFYGTCTTAANTAAKIVKLADATPDSATLITGMLLAVKFTNANSVANPTLTIQWNANTTNLIAAKPIMVYGSTAAGTASGTAWRAGAVILFIYDGTNWVITDYNDYSIHQNAAITTAGNFNILGGNAANDNEQIGSVNKLSGLTYNPSTNVLINTGATDKVGQIYLNSPSFSYGFLNGSGGTNHGIYDAKAGKWVLMGNANHQWYGNFNANGGLYLSCSTAAGTEKKVISYSPFNLQVGSSVYVTFTATNTKENPTLNINSTGDIAMYYKGARIKYQGLATGFVYHFIYDGTYWQLINKLSLPYTTCTSNANANKVVTCNGFILYTGATIDILFTKENSVAQPTLNINNTGAKPIIWLGKGIGTNNRNEKIDNISYKNMRANRVYRFVYDGTNYRLLDDTFGHEVVSGVTAKAAVTYTQDEYDQYVTDNGTAPSWNVGDVKTPAVAAVTGYERLEIGNQVTSNNNGGMTGEIWMWGAGTSKHIVKSALTGGTNRTIYIPNYGGDGYLTHTAAATAVGSTTKPVYVAANGRISEANTYAGGTAVTLNNASKAGSTASFYAPTAGGTAGQVLQSAGNATPTWITATNANTASTIVKRDASGNFSAGTITATLSGTATNANYVNLYEARGTTTTLNKAANYVGAGKMFHLIASSSTSATDNGKTPTDANVLQMNWDNNGGYDAQIAVSTSANRMWFRDQPSAKKAWREVVTSTPGTATGSSSEAIYVDATGITTKIATADLKAGKDGSGNTITSTYATKTEMNSLVAAADAMVFKGTLAGAATTTYTPAASRGDTYKVSTAGLINGERVEVGDILICTTDSTAAATSSNVSTVKANWAIVQNNVDGAVFKSTNTFTDGQILVADGTNGKIKTSGYAPGSFILWQSTTKKSTELYDFGFYVNNNAAAGTGPSGGNYFTILNLPYRKATGNTKADWGWQIGSSSSNDGRLFYRTTGDNVFGDWQEIAHATRSGNSIGSATQPVYMTATGVITAGTALKALAYKDSLTAADVGLGNVANKTITVTSTSVSDGTNTFNKYTHPTTEGNKHIPSGGSSGQFLGWDSAGTAKWVANPNTDTKVNVVARGTTKAYLLADTTAPTSTAAAHTVVAETAVYLDTTAGKLVATSFAGNGSALTSLNASNLGSGTVPIARIPTGTTSSTVALGNHTHNYAGSSSAGGAANSLTNFKVTTSTNLWAVDSPTTNAIGYQSGLTKANWNYQQTDGASYVQWYSANWIHQIFGDYRTGQLSVRGKNNGTWQAWRRILDETNAATILGLGSAAYTASTNYAAATHTHARTDIGLTTDAMSANLDSVTRPMVGSAASNKSFNLPAAAIVIEYSTDGGSTWTDYGATDAQKIGLFSETRATNFYLGKASAKANNTVNNQLRVTIEPTDRYTSFDAIYVWMSTQGNTVVMDLERSTIGAKNTFTTVFTGQTVSGWSGNNIRYFPQGQFGGGTSQTSNNYKYRVTFRQTVVNTNYASAQIIDIRFYGLNVWSSPNNMVAKNHIYTWDNSLNTTFPAKVAATTFEGNLDWSYIQNKPTIPTIGTGATNAAAGNHNHDGVYLKLTGGTLTGALGGTTATMSGAIEAGGNITFGNGTIASLVAKTPSRTSSFITVGGGKKTAGTADGTAVRLGAGGVTLIGGGEYANNRYNVADLGDGDEQLYLGSDGSVFIETNGQTIANRKTFTFTTNGNIEVPNIIAGEQLRYGLDLFARPFAAAATPNDSRGGEIYYDAGANDGYTKSQWHFRQYSWNATKSTTPLTYYDNFYLPNTTSGLTANGSYAILTSKSAVTIAQGGTGATTAAAALTNLGAAASGHTHPISLVSGGTSTINLAANTAYTLTAGGNSVIFKTPADADTKNTAGSTNSDSKLFLIGATSQAANPQTYSDSEVYTTNGTLTAKIVSTSAGIHANTANSGTAGGVSLYATNPNNYGLVMRNTGTASGQLGKHGYVQGDWAGYLTFTGAVNRGYIFRHAGANVASVSGEGHAVFNGSVTVGGNDTNTSGVRMTYVSATESLDFIFA